MSLMPRAGRGTRKSQGALSSQREQISLPLIISCFLFAVHHLARRLVARNNELAPEFVTLISSVVRDYCPGPDAYNRCGNAMVFLSATTALKHSGRRSQKIRSTCIADSALQSFVTSWSLLHELCSWRNIERVETPSHQETLGPGSTDAIAIDPAGLSRSV